MNIFPLQRQTDTKQQKSDIMTTKRKTNDDTQESTLNAQPKEQKPRFLTRQETADMLHVTVQTIINYTNRGLLSVHKIGRRVLYNLEEVMAAVQSEQVKRYQHESTRVFIFNK